MEEIYTYKDYLSWETNERFEIIDGVAYAMTSGERRILLLKFCRQAVQLWIGK